MGRAMKVFVVVDVMFPYVMAEETEYIGKVVAAVQAARDAGYFICVLEHRGPAHWTHKAILDVLEGYEQQAKATKTIWNGSQWVQQMLKEKDITPDEITVCGAISEECVLYTVEGLRYRYGGTAIKVSTPACLNLSKEFDWSADARRLNFRCVDQL